MKNALREALDDRGYETLTPVQNAVLESGLEGKDLLVSAQTGSGKTLGFGLAIAPTLLQEAEKFTSADAPLGLVVAPTRELALQVKRELSWLFAKAGAVLASCVGGMDMRDERRALARGTHIVVATPGRLRDHIMRGSIDLSSIRAIVLDEADEMLDLGFREDLEFILGEAPEDRQTLLFSATVPNTIAKLAKSYQRDAVRIVTKSETSQHADISYKALQVATHDAENAVINTLLYHKAPNALVFGNTRAIVNRLTTRLSNRGFQVVSLSGELSQAERTHALQAMRDGRAQVCVATDVAARGIDLPNLDLVVHAELPSNHETLLHRSGRTGRAGRKGVSALIVTRRSQKKADRILNMAKVKAEWIDAPSADEVNKREEERMFADETWQTPVDGSQQEIVEKLQETFSPSQLAAAYLRLYRSVRSAPEELSAVEAKPQPRGEFGPSIWFSITGGRKVGAEPRRVLPMLCKSSDLTKHDIGAIRVRQDESFVQIKETSVPGFLASIEPNMTLEPGAVVSQLAEPPVLEDERPGPGRGPRKHKPFARGKSRDDDRPPYKKPRHAKRGKNSENHDKKFDPERESKAAKSDKSKSDKPKSDKPKAEKYKSENAKFEKPKYKKAAGSKNKPKGPPTPVGKPNSKKNKARALAAKNKNKAKDGGASKPKR